MKQVSDGIVGALTVVIALGSAWWACVYALAGPEWSLRIVAIAAFLLYGGIATVGAYALGAYRAPSEDTGPGQRRS